MGRIPEPTDPESWQPATSEPGELYTVEGQIRARGVFVRGLKNKDVRLRGYRRSMLRTAWVFVGVAIVAGVVLTIIAAIL